jgi:hypothetical protein
MPLADAPMSRRFNYVMGDSPCCDRGCPTYASMSRRVVLVSSNIVGFLVMSRFSIETVAVAASARELEPADEDGYKVCQLLMLYSFHAFSMEI